VGFVGTKGLIGLDIGSSSIKGALFSFSGSIPKLEKALYLPTPAESVVDGGVVLPDLIASTISNQWAKAFSISRVNVAISAKHSVLKQFWLEPVGGTPIDEQVKWEVEKYLPLPVEEMQITHQPLNETDTNMEVLVGAAPIHILDGLLRVCRLAKLTPVAMEVPYLSILRLFMAWARRFPQQGAHFLLDVGASQTQVVFISDGVLSFVRSVQIGGNSFTEAIASNQNLTFEEAEIVKLTKATLIEEEATEDQTKAIYTAILPVMYQLAQEMQRSLDFFQSRSNTALAMKMQVFGGGSLLRGFPEAISQAMGIETAVWQPLMDLPHNDSAVLTELFPLLNLAAGLALKDNEKVVLGDLVEKMGISLLS
jgi:type IV pilus assembly protein PilM